ncbi:PREDICTED: interferon regulatory factor 3 isoform X1 [Gekko japonicus]|uniref:Interferon regulatory factor 3 isoform X1 n=1 Tax=Gekko japonicus TaxID=146911 RepID=A0ABM1JRA8_GEKJA|nr:PREDICTED: interferon regulatory factor 3 isoform X1 [Gekko japonicus]XP_015263995.1 PREDICTED: interferon regulatory factor 3 isoform X1 [Gekko japonicus]
MGAQRPLIVPWLLEQLDAQRFPGVSWLNPERTRFRIPWKHGSRHSTIPEDFQLFEAWAIASGRFDPRTDPRTPSDWKRNFRSALNRKPEIKLITDNSTDSEDPHKVFEIQHPVGPNDYAQPVADEVHENLGACGDSSPSCQDDLLENVLKSLDLSGSEQGAENPAYYAALSPSGLDLTPLTVPMIPLEPAFCANNFVQAADNTASCVGLPPSGLDQAPPATPLLPLQQIMESSVLETDFEVRAYYRGRLVFNDTFSNVRGLCFLPPGSQVPYPDLAAVVLPDAAILNDQMQATLTSRILHRLAPGVLLRIEGPLLCGSRLGRCHVFWSQSETPTAGMRCGGLPKEHLGPIYSLQQFVQELIGFMEGRRGSPDYTLWFCFGEDWPDPDPTRLWKKKLIMVQVIPKVFETLHELSKASGASSLNGAEPDLRISDSLQDPSLLERLRDWEGRMDVQFSS